MILNPGILFPYWMAAAALKYLISLVILVYEGAFSFDDTEDNEWLSYRGTPFRLLFILARPWLLYFPKTEVTDKKLLMMMKKIGLITDPLFILLSCWAVFLLLF